MNETLLPNRRVKIAEVNLEVLINLLMQSDHSHTTRVIEGLPSDVQIRLAQINSNKRILLTLSSDTWPEIEPNTIPSSVSLVVREYEVASLLVAAEVIIRRDFGNDSTSWLERYRAIKEEL